LPWLLAPALHDIESWDERLAADERPRRAGAGEWLRRAGDLEHWAAFRESFQRLAALLQDAAKGPDGGRPPGSVVVLSGDVHHSYVATVGTDPGTDPGTGPDTDRPAPVHQVTCSPLHNSVPRPMRLAFRLAWSRVAERTVRVLLSGLGTVPPPRLHWRRTAGPFFGNAIGTLLLDGRRASLTIESSQPPPHAPLRVLHTQDLSR
jgi:hypothetical protein